MLFKNKDVSLELHVVNYEFPAGGGDPDSDDRNWLVLRCTWINGEGAIVKDSNSCLLTYELREMTAGLKVLNAGIRDSFRGLVTSAETGAGKDVSPEIYERAMRRLRSNKKDTVIFEDALHAIRTAKAAGFRVAAIYDPSAEEDQAEIRALADYYFRSFEELFETRALE